MAYVRAVIASSGFNFGKDELDRNKEDIYIRHQLTTSFTPTYSRLNVQVKCTYAHGLNNHDKMIHFPLDMDTYNKLRLKHIEPHILVVVIVPRPEEEPWLECVNKHTILRHRAYWVSLRGAGDPKSSGNVTVYIPEKNTFDTNAVYWLMSQIAQGKKDL
jgi:Domain of unknown function (DUF4365)